MPSARNDGPVEVLLIEDSSGDVRLTQEGLRDADPAIRLHVANDGAEAMAFLNQTGGYRDAARPDVILLDLNMPTMNGHEVLALIKTTLLESAALQHDARRQV